MNHPSVYVWPVCVLVLLAWFSIVPDLFTGLVFAVPAAVITLIALLILNRSWSNRIARRQWPIGGGVAAIISGLALFVEWATMHR